jgi:hypothetical protein
MTAVSGRHVRLLLLSRALRQQHRLHLCLGLAGRERAIRQRLDGRRVHARSQPHQWPQRRRHHSLSDKQTLVSAQASSTLGADGDSQITWLTPEIGPDRSNAHVAVFDDHHTLVSWEEIEEPECEFVAMGCGGVFTGTYYQLVDKEGKSVGEPIKSMDTYVAGDMVRMGDGRMCWPYVEMGWSLSKPSWYGSVDGQTKAQSMSFACVSLDM